MRRRMLWVGSAAIPLHNITWVDAFRLKPNRWKIFLRSLIWMAVAFVVYAFLTATSGGGGIRIAGNGDFEGRVLLGALVLAVVITLFAWSKPVLAIETAGGSRVVVTLPNMDELRQIAAQIVYAINHPEAEFTAVVNQFTSNNTNHFGPVVNMNGGGGNTGIRL
ncbi:DUF6232 family protein [Streptomyces sp. NPDC029216]|uniref:DUF6232 family protein n=1 Tax=Streptomyces sp. NPDC029216 TaxID=3154701 RepID=UPI0033CAFE20